MSVDVQRMFQLFRLFNLHLVQTLQYGVRNGWTVDRKEAWSHCSRGCEAGGAAAKVNQKQEQVRGLRRDLDDGGGGKMQELCLEDSSLEIGTKSPKRI